MNYRSFGRTGVQVSELCLGTMMFGGPADEDESLRIAHAALEAGINLIDTADSYSKGRAEEIVGRALAESGRRERVVLATKFHGPVDGRDPNARGNHRRHIVAACEASLRRLQTDWIDLYQIHRPDPLVPIDETLRALDDLVRAGKVRYIGTSTFAAWQIVESLWASKELGLNRVVCEQPPYHLLDRRVERELIPMAQTFGMAILPWSPLAGGFLTGKYKRGASAPAGARFDESAGRGAIHFSEPAFAVVDALHTIARNHAATPSQVAVSWLSNRPGVTSPIVGPRTLDQFEEVVGATRLSLDQDETRALDVVAPPGRAIAPYYQAAFGPHPYRW